MPIWGREEVVFAHVKQKLRSQRGASLSMALMLFLVCAVVASIVLAAATAASGRQSQLEAMDKSYYNVTSAAKLLWDELGQGTQSVTITCECDATKASGGSYENFTNWKGTIGTSFSSDPGTGQSSYLSKGNATLFEMLAYDIMFGPSQSTCSFDTTRELNSTKVAGSIDTKTLQQNENLSFDATYDGFDVTASAGYADVLVKVSAKAKRDNSSSEPGKISGGITFVLGEKNASASDGFVARSYKCTLSSSADVDESGCRVKKVGEQSYHLTWVTKISWDTEDLQLGAQSGGDES